MATTTVNRSNERMLNWNCQRKTSGGEEPEEHEHARGSNARHGDQYRPALVPVEGEPAEPLRQKQETLHRQQPARRVPA